MQTRRELIWKLGAVGLVVAAGGGTPEHPLGAQRLDADAGNAKETGSSSILSITYRIRSSGKAAQDGGSLANVEGYLLANGAKFSSRVTGSDGSFVQIFDGAWGVDAFLDAQDIVLVRKRWDVNARRGRPNPLELFVPELASGPLGRYGRKLVDGANCIGLVSRGSVVWRDEQGRTREIEVYGDDRAQVLQRISYSAFSSVGGVLDLPWLVRTEEFDQQGKPTGTKTITVVVAEALGQIPAEAFSIEAVPPQGERARPSNAAGAPDRASPAPTSERIQPIN